MFRKPNVNKHPEPLPVPRRKIVINPAKITSHDSQYLSQLLSEFPAETVFRKDTPYLVPPFYEFTLTNTLIKRAASDGDCCEYEVVGNEYNGSATLDCYELDGVILVNRLACQFMPFSEYFCVAFKEELDPVNLTSAQSQLLGVVLMRAYNELDEKYFPAGLNSLELEIEYNIKLLVHFNLKYPIVARTRENYPDQLRFEVMGKNLGGGYFAEAFKVITTLVPHTDGSLQAKDSHRMLKMQTHEHEYVEPEYQKAALTPHLHAKRPVFTTRLKQKYSFLVSKFIDGHTLERYLASDARKQILTIEDRLHLSLAMIRALGEQVHKQGIIHRDVSLANIIANFAAREYPTAAYIDMGLSKFTSVSDRGEVCGTPKFVAPEVMGRSGTSAASDIYSLGVVLSELWKVNLHPKALATTALGKALANTLAGGLRGLSSAERSLIAETIHTMCSVYPFDRGSLRDAEAVFEQLAFERRAHKLNVKNRQAMQTVHTLALNLRRQIRDDCLANGAQCEIDHVRLAVERLLLQFSDQPLLVREFVTTLGISALNGMATREGVREKLKAMTSEYIFKREDLYCSIEALSRIVNGSEFHLADPLYQQYLNMILTSAVRHASLMPALADDVVVLAQKFSRDIIRIRIELDRIEQLGVQAISCTNVPRPLPGRVLPASLYGLFAPPAKAAAPEPRPSHSAGLR
jgi:serine/threonine protein kinase